MSMSDKVCIVGVGYTEQGVVPGKSTLAFNLEAAKAAMDDAGVSAADIDAVISFTYDGVTAVKIADCLGINMNFTLTQPSSQPIGVYAEIFTQIAAMAIRSGLCHTVLLTYGNVGYSVPAGPKMGQVARDEDNAAFGYQGAALSYALAARTHMNRYGTKSEHFGTIAIAERQWANLNPIAQMYNRPLTMEGYLDSRWIAEPFRLLDCCLVSDIGRAIIVTTEERARNLRRKPVYIEGMGQTHSSGDILLRPDLTCSAVGVSARQALESARVELKDIDLLELYDCFTYTVLVTLEGLGYCEPGEGGDFVSDGKLGPGGSLPTNTSGGQLSEAYAQGWTPLCEAIVQLQGQAGDRQVAGARTALVNGNGGMLAHQATLILRN
jgi:acetyl-CoA acetyltransferase